VDCTRNTYNPNTLCVDLVTPSNSPTASVTPSTTLSAGATPSNSPSETASVSATATNTGSTSLSATPTSSPTASITPSATFVPVPPWLGQFFYSGTAYTVNANGYLWAMRPFRDVMQSGFSVGRVYTGFETLADPSCASGLRYYRQTYSLGDYAAGCDQTLPGPGQRQSLITWACNSSVETAALMYINEPQACRYILTFGVNCFNFPQSGTLCVEASKSATPSATPTASVTASITASASATLSGGATTSTTPSVTASPSTTGTGTPSSSATTTGSRSWSPTRTPSITPTASGLFIYVPECELRGGLGSLWWLPPRRPAGAAVCSPTPADLAPPPPRRALRPLPPLPPAGLRYLQFQQYSVISTQLYTIKPWNTDRSAAKQDANDLGGYSGYSNFVNGSTFVADATCASGFKYNSVTYWGGTSCGAFGLRKSVWNFKCATDGVTRIAYINESPTCAYNLK
jgi:hypothetical protein